MQTLAGAGLAVLLVSSECVGLAAVLLSGRLTNVMPTATTPVTLACVRTVSRLSRVRNCFLAEQLDCQGNVVEIQGLAGISVTEERTAGFADTVEQLCGGGIRIVAQQPADFLPDKGLQVMETILQSEPEIDAVYTHDDDMATGVVSAIENAGREDEMILTGAGGSREAMEQIQEGGLYAATFLYSPSMSASAVRVARLIALGEGFEELVEPEVPSRIELPATTVTRDNVEDVMDLGF